MPPAGLQASFISDPKRRFVTQALWSRGVYNVNWATTPRRFLLPLSIALGVSVGVAIDQVGVGAAVGVAIGAALYSSSKK